jgi:Ribonuclease G/E
MEVPELLYNRGELHNLSVSRGTLTAEDRYKINEHIVQTIRMLSTLPFPKHLRQVPELAGGHHEKMDGNGYPRRLTRSQMSPVARMMAIADVFEALTAVDVNSGRYVGKKSLEETITKINTEAAKEIVYQLRLRNIGGIIICDFIDMEKQQNRDKVFKSLHEALGRDKAKTNVLRISELGLVEMTRKRVRESIGRVLHENCGYCAGQGYVKTATTVAYEIFRELRRSAGAYQDPTLVVQAQTEVANVIQGEEREELRHLMDRFNKSIQVKPRSDFHREQYDIYARPVSGVEIKIAATTVEHDPATYTNSRKPGSTLASRLSAMAWR